jgi:hypothetical protein
MRYNLSEKLYSTSGESMVNYAIAVPVSTAWSPDSATALVRLLLEDEKLQDNMTSFTMRGHYNSVESCLRGLPDEVSPQYLTSLIRTIYPTSEVRYLRSFHTPYPLHRRFMFLGSVDMLA